MKSLHNDLSRTLRQKLGLSQSKFSIWLDISYYCVVNVENCRCNYHSESKQVIEDLNIELKSLSDKQIEALRIHITKSKPSRTRLWEALETVGAEQ